LPAYFVSCGKAPGKDGIPPEVLKSGKSALLQHLFELLCLCWEKGYIPEICATQTSSLSTKTKETMGGGKGKKDVNAKLTTNFINILKYKTNHL
jgi:hypothetical protein